jgi:imidazolonepropionase-like amidohydrolase
MRRKNHFGIVRQASCLVGLALTLTCATLRAQNTASALVLNDVNLIDGTGAPAQPHMRIVIRGERIQSVEAAAGAMPAGAAIWNLHGMSVIPGLIDAHVHLTTGPGNLPQIAQMLRFGLLGGVTSVRDMGGDDIVLAELAGRFKEAGEAGPRIYYSTLVAGPQWFADPRPKASSHGGVAGEVAWMRAVEPQSDIPAIIQAGKATGATGLKIYADLAADLVNRLTAEAHRQGLRVWTHSAIFPAKPSEVVQAGVDVISHSNYLGAEGMKPPPASYEAARRGLGIDYAASPVDGDAIASLLKLMKAKATILDETLFVTNAGKRSEEDPVWTWTVAVTRRAHEAGIPLAAGTDSFGNPARDGVPNIHQEMRLLVEKCGLTPLEAIASATSIAARAIAIDKMYGTVEAGKAADLVILREDPSSDISKTKNIAAVVKGGVVYQR